MGTVIARTGRPAGDIVTCRPARRARAPATAALLVVAASHLAVAMAGSVIVLAAGRLGAGLAHGIVGDDLGQVPRLLGAALV
ncbi:hypothetical protein ACI2L1_30335 [Streptomyces sp. NPDC019531]|uniref:hypothetical protein n=1 Tax=Streptomyces sp. NPDC019531 TaxID=3365062 RepID=UPI00384BE362